MPIIESLLDADFYKFTMGQLALGRHPGVAVRYAFRNRTNHTKLVDVIDEAELRHELDHARTLRFTRTELHYLRGTNEYGDRMFHEPYLEFLAGLELPPYELDVKDGQFVLEFPGLWPTAIYWETIALAIINELYYRKIMESLKSRFERELVFAEGKRRLAEKIKTLRRYPELTFCDFGTRRRFSREWQDYVVGILAEEMDNQLLGTSNTLLAMKHGLLPMGTSAHEMFMVMSGIVPRTDETIRDSHHQTLKEWWEQYGWGLSIALTDTFGTDFCLRDMTSEQARKWKGLRQDSGDPIAFGEKAIAFYQRHGVNPREKLIIFSDGLDVDVIIRIAAHFRDRIKVSFGWGTNLTNDLGFGALSLVIKVVEAGGHGTVKLSDNLAKAIGKPEDVERFKRVFGYTGDFSEDCRY